MPSIVCVVGTRPEAVKMAPVVLALRAAGGFDVRLVATGQHRELAADVLDYFDLAPDATLDALRPGQSLAALAARLLAGLDETLAVATPDLVLAQGDTSSAFAAAQASFLRRVPFGHVEAGLRSHSLSAPFPEEMHRVLTARLAAIHFAPTSQAAWNLRAEGIAAERIVVTGNTVVDALHATLARRPASPVVAPSERRVLLCTVHRRENLGRPLLEVCDAVKRLASRGDVEVVWPVHPHPAVRETVHARLANTPGVRLLEPLAYPAFVALLARSHFALTDSGGVQEEAPALGKPVLVLRETTERPEGVDAGNARVVGVSRRAILEAAERLLDEPAEYAAAAQVQSPYGDGRAAERVVAAVRAFLASADAERRAA